MEFLVIIYGIVWLLLLSFSLYLYFTEKEKIFRRDNCHMWILLFAFGPIILLGIILYVTVSSIWDKKEKYEPQKKKVEEAAKKKQAVDNYKKCHDSLVDAAIIEQIGNRLEKINYTPKNSLEEFEILDVLDKIKLSEGYSLQLQYSDCQGIGGRTYINVKKPNGNLTEKFLDFIYVDDSPLGALQVYFLSKLWHHLPLSWHGLYDQRFSVFSNNDLSNIQIRQVRPKSKPLLRPSDIRDELIGLPEEALACDVTPKVAQYEDKYYVSCCYWSRFGGLIRELVEIKIENNKVTDFLDANREVLYGYHCGIMY